MIKVKHFENGIKTFQSEKEFIMWVNGIFGENEEDKTLSPPKDAEEAGRYIAHYCDNWTMIYYQLTEKEMIDADQYSFQVYINEENLKKDFPNKHYLQYEDDDIEDFSVIDFSESFI